MDSFDASKPIRRPIDRDALPSSNRFGTAPHVRPSELSGLLSPMQR